MNFEGKYYEFWLSNVGRSANCMLLHYLNCFFFNFFSQKTCYHRSVPFASLDKGEIKAELMFSVWPKILETPSFNRTCVTRLVTRLVTSTHSTQETTGKWYLLGQKKKKKYVALSRPTVKCEKNRVVFFFFFFFMSDLGEEFAKICIQWLKKALAWLVYGSEFWTMYNWVQTWGKIKISEVLRATYLA